MDQSGVHLGYRPLPARAWLLLDLEERADAVTTWFQGG
jgi:hypothetical protein